MAVELGQHLETLCRKPERLVVGLMSGTSMDGIDAALVRIRGAGIATEVQLVAFCCHAYEAGLRQRLWRAASGEACSALDWARLDFQVAASFAQAALAVVEEAGLPPQAVDFIASHGQTLAHRGGGSETWDPSATTWQAGNLNALSALAGLLVVGDFRTADVALGGTGAPLVPYVDFLLRRSASENRVLLNLGGIANVTYLPAGCDPNGVLAWDVGPGNMLLDAAAQSLCQQPFDPQGTLAASGSVDDVLLRDLLAHPFLARAAPKSAGREEFGGAYTSQVLESARRRQLAAADVLATLVQQSARAVAQALHQPPLAGKPLDCVYVTGGGRRNTTLMSALASHLTPVRLAGIEVLGVDADAKEAVDFAVLGNETLHGYAGNLTQVTGAQRPVILGALAAAGLAPRLLTV